MAENTNLPEEKKEEVNEVTEVTEVNEGNEGRDANALRLNQAEGLNIGARHFNSFKTVQI